MQGKKQENIRVDNKLAVIEILLHKECTVLQLSQYLGLSHTAISKVINDMAEKNVIKLVEVREASMGRPPKVYGINEDCAIACAVIVTNQDICIYYVDMRGFQINNISCKNNFDNLEILLNYITTQLIKLKIHKRIKDKILNNLYFGIPMIDFFGKNYGDIYKKILSYFKIQFPKINIVINSNIDYELIAEKEYGIIKDYKKNVLLVNFDEKICCSLLLNGNIYVGDNKIQGYYNFSDMKGVSYFPEGIEKFAEKYINCNSEAIEYVNCNFGKVLILIGEILKFLDIEQLVLSGKISLLKQKFLNFAKGILPANCQVSYSIMGKEVISPLSGAIWLSTYNTLNSLVL